MPGGAHENMRGWSPEEDELLLQLIETSGKRWKLIAEALGTANPRTPAMVRNRYLRIERGRWLTEQGMSKNRCGQCGELKRGHMCKMPRAMGGTSFAAQEARNGDARERVCAPSDRPGGLSLGAPPLTMPMLNHSEGQSDAHSMMSSPGPLSCGLLTGLSPLPGTTPNGGVSFHGLAGGPPSLSGGPPALRAQNSMDILLQASDLHRIRATETTPTPTPLASEFEHNPFKLPTVSASDIPDLENLPQKGPAREAVPSSPLASTGHANASSPLASTGHANATADLTPAPKGCAEAAGHAERASSGAGELKLDAPPQVDAPQVLCV